MKTLLVMICLLWSTTALAQWSNPENARLTNTINGFMNSFGGGGFPPAIPIQDNNYYYHPNMFTNNTLYQQSHPELLFQKRQINKYYSALEEAQKLELKQLKKSNSLTVEEVDRIFRRNNDKY